jgi:hypothetical protein
MPVLSEQKQQERTIQFHDYIRQLKQEREGRLSEADLEKLALQHLEAEMCLLNEEKSDL